MEDFKEVLKRIYNSDLSWEDRRTTALVAAKIHGFDLIYNSETLEWSWKKI